MYNGGHLLTWVTSLGRIWGCAPALFKLQDVRTCPCFWQIALQQTIISCKGPWVKSEDGPQGWQSKNSSQVELPTTSGSDHLSLIDVLGCWLSSLIRYHHRQLHWDTTAVCELADVSSTSLLCFYLISGGVALSLTSLFLIKWDRSELPRKHLETREAVCLLPVLFSHWKSLKPLEILSVWDSANFGESGDVVNKTIYSLTLSCRVYSVPWSTKVSQAYSRVLGFPQVCSWLWVIALWNFCGR